MNKNKWTSKAAIAAYSVGGVAVMTTAITVPVVVASTKDNTIVQSNLSVTKDSLGILFNGDEGFGTISRKFNHPNIQVEYSKPTNLKNGDKVIVTLTGLNGYTINGAAKIAYEYIVAGLRNVIVVNNITINQEDLGITFSGINGKGILNSNVTRPDISQNLDITFDKTTDLSINDMVTAVVTAKDGYTVNNKSSETFTFPVYGLIRDLAVSKEDLGVVFEGLSGSAIIKANINIPGAFDVSFSKEDQISSGDKIIVTLTAKTGYKINGKDVENYEVFAPQLTQNIIFTSDMLGVTYKVVDNIGTLQYTYRSDHVTVTFDKTTNITNGEEVTATLTPKNGFLINNKTSETFKFIASGITIISDISMSVSDFNVVFTGTAPNGTASVSTTNPNVDVVVEPASGLSNNSVVKVTATAKPGYSINGLPTYVFYKTVDPNTLTENTNIDVNDLGISFDGYNGLGILNSTFSNPNYSIVFNKSNNLINGDVVMATITGLKNHTVNGKTSDNIQINVSGLISNEVITSDMLGVSFAGISGQGTLASNYINENIVITPSKTTGLVNGEYVTFTLVAKNGFHVNGKSSDTITIPVFGLKENILLDLNSVNSFFAGYSGEGIVYTDFYNKSVFVSIDKISQLSNGDKLTVTLTAADGYVINGQTSVTFERTVSGLVENISLDSSDLDVTFSGVSGQGTANVGYSNPNLNIVVEPVNDLINGQTVKVTVTAKNGYAINRENSFEFFYHVEGLDVPYTINEQTLAMHFTGVDGEGSFTYDYSNPNVDISFDKTTGLTTGDVITATLAPHAGFVVNGSKLPTTISIVVPRLWVFKFNGDSTNGEYSTIKNAQDALAAQTTKPMVYVVGGVEYLDRTEALNKYLEIEQNLISGPVTFANANLPVDNPNHIDGSLVSTLGQQITDSNVLTGYEFNGKVYFSLNEATAAWVALQTPIPAQNGSATVQVTNPSFPGTFNVVLDSATADHEIISNLTWSAPTSRTILGSESNYNIAFTNPNTTAYMVDPVTSSQILTYNKSVLFSNTPYTVNTYSLAQTKAPSITTGTLPLSFNAIDSTGASAFFAVGSTKLTVDKQFPTMINGVYNPGTMSDTDLFWVFSLFQSGSPVTIDSPAAGKISIRWYDKSDTLRTIVINQPPVGAGGLSSDWRTLNYGSISTTNANLVQSKAAMVKQMVKDGLISNVLNYRTNTTYTRGEYNLTLNYNTNPSSSQTLKVYGPADATALTASNFALTISGGTADQFYDDYNLQYKGSVIPGITTSVRKDSFASTTTPPVITDNDLIITITSAYIPRRDWTTADAPAMNTWTYLPSLNPSLTANNPVQLASFESDVTTYSGYIFTDVSDNNEQTFYNTYDDATHAAFADFAEDIIPQQATDFVEYNGVVYDNLADLFVKEIYIASSTQVPLLFGLKDSIEDIYQLRA